MFPDRCFPIRGEIMLPTLSRRLFLAATVSACLARAGHAEEPTGDLNGLVLRTGDLLFQHVPSHLSSFVADLGEWPVSNVGLVFVREGRAYVFDTLVKVRLMPLRDWLAQGLRGEYLLARDPVLTMTDAEEVVRTAATWLDRPHDLRLAQDDQAFTGAELAHKAFLRGARIQLSRQSRLADLRWKANESYLREAFRGELPLHTLLTVPETLLTGRRLHVVANELSAVLTPATETPGEETPLHRRMIGTWTGQYRLDPLTTAVAVFKFGYEGEFERGTWLLPDGSTRTIQRIGIIPLEASGEFRAELVDERGFTAELQGHLRDNGERLIATWKDERAQRGLCSLARLPGSGPQPPAAIEQTGAKTRP
jgi:hypothetical protein